MSPSGQRPISAFLGTSAASIVTTMLTFISGILIARALSPEGRGEYGAMLLIGQTVGSLACLSFFDGAIVELRRSPARLNSVLPSMFAMALVLWILAATLLALGLSFYPLVKIGMAPEFVIIFSGSLILDIMIWYCFSAAERSQMEFKLTNILRLVAPAAFSALLVASSIGWNGVLSVELVLMLYVLAKLPVMLIWLIRYKDRLIGSVSLGFINDAGAVGLRLHAAVALGVIASQLDRLIATSAWPKDQLGHYFVAYSAVGAGYTVIASAVNIVLFPYLAGIDSHARSERVTQIIRLTLIISLGTVLVGLGVLPLAIPLLYGPDYLLAVPMAVGLLCAMAVTPLRAVVLETTRSFGQGRASLEMGLVSSVVMLCLLAVTGLSTPTQMITALGLANLASTLIGIKHLVRAGVITIGRQLLPGASDFSSIAKIWTSISRK